MAIQIRGDALGIHIGSQPGIHKVLVFTAGDFPPGAPMAAPATITIPFDEPGWQAFQQMIANEGAGSRVIPVGADAIAKLPPPPKMAVPKSR